jgi:hypothetical protein
MAPKVAEVVDLQELEDLYAIPDDRSLKIMEDELFPELVYDGSFSTCVDNWENPDPQFLQALAVANWYDRNVLIKWATCDPTNCQCKHHYRRAVEVDEGLLKHKVDKLCVATPSVADLRPMFYGSNGEVCNDGVDVVSVAPCIPMGIGAVRLYTKSVVDYVCQGKRYNFAFARKEFARAFRVMVAGVNYDSTNHSHPLAARLRYQANVAMVEFVKSIGRTVYWVSPSDREIRLGGRFIRQHHNIKDLKTELAFQRPTVDSVICMTDVDYYTDMHFWMSFGVPILMYTMLPTQVESDVPDGHFVIKGNQLELTMNGSAKPYVHEVWDWGADLVSNKGWNRVWIYDVSYHVMSGDQHRRVVFLTPAVKVYKWLRPDVAEYQLQRKRYQYGDASVVLSSCGKIVSIRRAAVGLTMGRETLSDCWQRYCLSDKRNSYDLQKICERYHEKGAEHLSLHLLAWFENGFVPELFDMLTVVPVKAGIDYLHYTTTETYSEGEPIKTYAREVAPPVVSAGAVCPTECLANDKACIENRVLEVKNYVKLTPQLLKYADEFVSLVVPACKSGKGVPWKVEDVRNKQAKPAQESRSNLVRYSDLDAARTNISAFQKRETYGKINAPRNISSVNTEHTLIGSCFTYPFKYDILKRLHWYGPGKDPTQTTQSLRELAGRSELLEDCDFSKMDGTVSMELRDVVELQCYARWVKPEFKAQLIRVFRSEYRASAVTKNGVKYDPDGSRLSGSPWTTDGNTILNAFKDFVARRLFGLDAKAAFRTLGLYYGDDSVAPVCKQQVAGQYSQKAAELLGFSVKVHVNTKRDRVIPYLGRLYLNPWLHGQSIQDPVRTLQKINISCDSGVDTHVAAVNRATGYLATDAGTPLIGPYCEAILRILKDVKPGKMDADMMYRVTAGPYVSANYSQEAYEVVADRLNTQVASILDMETQLRAAGSFKDFPAPLPITTEVGTLPAVVAGWSNAVPKSKIRETTYKQARKTANYKPLILNNANKTKREIKVPSRQEIKRKEKPVVQKCSDGGRNKRKPADAGNRQPREQWTNVTRNDRKDQRDGPWFDQYL